MGQALELAVMRLDKQEREIAELRELIAALTQKVKGDGGTAEG
jgi:hypothetical protein